MDEHAGTGTEVPTGGGSHALTEHVLIVRVPRGLPCDALVQMELLLGLEGALDVKVLQGLVGVVDAQLLERVVLKRFETEEIEKADAERWRLLGLALRRRWRRRGRW